MKVERIVTKNVGPIGYNDADLRGASVIVTAPNRSGKSTILGQWVEYAQSLGKSKINIAENQKKGEYEITFTNGNICRITATASTTKAVYTKQGGETVVGITKIAKDLFGIGFDVHKFVNQPPADRTKQLFKLSGMAPEKIAQIDSDLVTAKTVLTYAKKDVTTVATDLAKLEELYRKTGKPTAVPQPESIDKIQSELAKIVAHNDALKDKYASKKLERLSLVHQHEREAAQVQAFADSIPNLPKKVRFYLDSVMNKGALLGMIAPMPPEVSEPLLKNTSFLESQIREHAEKMAEYNEYLRQKLSIEHIVLQGRDAREKLANYQAIVNAKTAKVAEIAQSRIDAINAIILPEGVEISESLDIMYNGRTLESASLSELYIFALKIGSLGLGELKYMHFEGSALDAKSLAAVKVWADSEGLQIAVERPTYNENQTTIEITEI